MKKYITKFEELKKLDNKKVEASGFDGRLGRFDEVSGIISIQDEKVYFLSNEKGDKKEDYQYFYKNVDLKNYKFVMEIESPKLPELYFEIK